MNGDDVFRWDTIGLDRVFSAVLDGENDLVRFDENANGVFEMGIFTTTGDNVLTEGDLSIMYRNQYEEYQKDEDEDGIVEYVSYTSLMQVSDPISTEILTWWDPLKYSGSGGWASFDFIPNTTKDKLSWGEKLDDNEDGVFEEEKEYLDLYGHEFDPIDLENTFETVRTVRQETIVGDIVGNFQKDGDYIARAKYGQIFQASGPDLSSIHIKVPSIIPDDIPKAASIAVSIRTFDPLTGVIGTAVSSIKTYTYSEWIGAADLGDGWLAVDVSSSGLYLTTSLVAGNFYVLYLEGAGNTDGTSAPGAVFATQSLDGDYGLGTPLVEDYTLVATDRTSDARCIVAPSSLTNILDGDWQIQKLTGMTIVMKSGNRKGETFTVVDQGLFLNSISSPTHLVDGFFYLDRMVDSIIGEKADFYYEPHLVLADQDMIDDMPWVPQEVSDSGYPSGWDGAAAAASRDLVFSISMRTKDETVVQSSSSAVASSPIDLGVGGYTIFGQTFKTDREMMEYFRFDINTAPASSSNILLKAYIFDTSTDSDLDLTPDFRETSGTLNPIAETGVFSFWDAYISTDTQKWMAIPLFCDGLDDTKTYAITLVVQGTADGTIKFETKTGGYSDGEVVVSGTISGTVPDASFKISTYDSEDEIQTVTFASSTNLLVTHQSWYLMGAGSSVQPVPSHYGLTFMEGDVIVQDGVTVVIDPRPTQPDTARLCDDGMIYWYDSNGDEIYETGFVFTSETKEYFEINTSPNSDGVYEYEIDESGNPIYMPVAIGYFLDYNLDMKMDTDWRKYRDDYMGLADEFYPTWWLSDVDAYAEIRGMAFDDAYQQYVDSTYGSVEWWIWTIVDIAVQGAIAYVSSKCGPAKQIVQMLLTLLWQAVIKPAIQSGIDQLTQMIEKWKVVARDYQPDDSVPYPHTTMSIVAKYRGEYPSSSNSFDRWWYKDYLYFIDLSIPYTVSETGLLQYYEALASQSAQELAEAADLPIFDGNQNQALIFGMMGLYRDLDIVQFNPLSDFDWTTFWNHPDSVNLALLLANFARVYNAGITPRYLNRVMHGWFRYHEIPLVESRINAIVTSESNILAGEEAYAEDTYYLQTIINERGIVQYQRSEKGPWFDLFAPAKSIYSAAEISYGWFPVKYKYTNTDPTYDNQLTYGDTRKLTGNEWDEDEPWHNPELLYRRTDMPSTGGIAYEMDYQTTMLSSTYYSAYDEAFKFNPDIQSKRLEQQLWITIATVLVQMGASYAGGGKAGSRGGFEQSGAIANYGKMSVGMKAFSLAKEVFWSVIDEMITEEIISGIVEGTIWAALETYTDLDPTNIGRSISGDFVTTNLGGLMLQGFIGWIAEEVGEAGSEPIGNGMKKAWTRICTEVQHQIDIKYKPYLQQKLKNLPDGSQLGADVITIANDRNDLDSRLAKVEARIYSYNMMRNLAPVAAKIKAASVINYMLGRTKTIVNRQARQFFDGLLEKLATIDHINDFKDNMKATIAIANEFASSIIKSGGTLEDITSKEFLMRVQNALGKDGADVLLNGGGALKLWVRTSTSDEKIIVDPEHWGIFINALFSGKSTIIDFGFSDPINAGGAARIDPRNLARTAQNLENAEIWELPEVRPGVKMSVSRYFSKFVLGTIDFTDLTNQLNGDSVHDDPIKEQINVRRARVRDLFATLYENGNNPWRLLPDLIDRKILVVDGNGRLIVNPDVVTTLLSGGTIQYKDPVSNAMMNIVNLMGNQEGDVRAGGSYTISLNNFLERIMFKLEPKSVLDPVYVKVYTPPSEADVRATGRAIDKEFERSVRYITPNARSIRLLDEMGFSTRYTAAGQVRSSGTRLLEISDFLNNQVFRGFAPLPRSLVFMPWLIKTTEIIDRFMSFSNVNHVQEVDNIISSGGEFKYDETTQIHKGMIANPLLKGSRTITTDQLYGESSRGYSDAVGDYIFDKLVAHEQKAVDVSAPKYWASSIQSVLLGLLVATSRPGFIRRDSSSTLATELGAILRYARSSAGSTSKLKTLYDTILKMQKPSGDLASVKDNERLHFTNQGPGGAQTIAWLINKPRKGDVGDWAVFKPKDVNIATGGRMEIDITIGRGKMVGGSVVFSSTTIDTLGILNNLDVGRHPVFLEVGETRYLPKEYGILLGFMKACIQSNVELPNGIQADATPALLEALGFASHEGILAASDEGSVRLSLATTARTRNTYQALLTAHERDSVLILDTFARSYTGADRGLRSKTRPYFIDNYEALGEISLKFVNGYVENNPFYTDKFGPGKSSATVYIRKNVASLYRAFGMKLDDAYVKDIEKRVQDLYEKEHKVFFKFTEAITGEGFMDLLKQMGLQQQNPDGAIGSRYLDGRALRHGTVVASIRMPSQGSVFETVLNKMASDPRHRAIGSIVEHMIAYVHESSQSQFYNAVPVLNDVMVEFLGVYAKEIVRLMCQYNPGIELKGDADAVIKTFTDKLTALATKSWADLQQLPWVSKMMQDGIITGDTTNYIYDSTYVTAKYGARRDIPDWAIDPNAQDVAKTDPTTGAPMHPNDLVKGRLLSSPGHGDHRTELCNVVVRLWLEMMTSMLTNVPGISTELINSLLVYDIPRNEWMGTGYDETNYRAANLANIFLTAHYGAAGEGSARGLNILLNVYFDLVNSRTQDSYTEILAGLNNLMLRKSNGRVLKYEYGNYYYVEAFFQNPRPTGSPPAPRYSMVLRIPKHSAVVVSRGVGVYWKATVDLASGHVLTSLGPTMRIEDIPLHIQAGDIDTFLAGYSSAFVTVPIGFRPITGSGQRPVQQLWELLTVFGNGNPNIILYPGVIYP
ncbi:MAG: hypothetical protein GYA36_21975 [Veillonellaceae bacterium]|nr:hypothetical protein [Veillonellaceae bacterium]